MDSEGAAAPDQPRRINSGQRADAAAAAAAARRPRRIARIDSGERATVANQGRSVTPRPARRRTPTSTTHS